MPGARRMPTLDACGMLPDMSPGLRSLASVLPCVAIAGAVASAVALPLAGLGYRFQWWGLRTGFSVLKWTTFAAGAALLVGVAGLLASIAARNGRSALLALVALVLAGAVLVLPLGLMHTARQVPPIHDITTDTENPPAFVAVTGARPGATNSTDYAGAAVAGPQRAAYPDIAPADLPQPPDRVFGAAVSAATSLGWTIVAAVPAEGRLEATDTSRWWGFKDDVVVRVRPTDRGSRVDVRSLSRVGISDLGVNARRIRAFLVELRSRAGS
jgi:uncharacterized protein (DUF1499 family)